MNNWQVGQWVVLGNSYPLKPALRTQEYVNGVFTVLNNKRALAYSKIECLRGEKEKPLFFEYVNGHFTVQNNTRGSTYSTPVEYVKENKTMMIGWRW